MARTVGQKLSIFLDEIYPILTSFLKTLKPDHSDDADNEIVECCLNTVENLIKKCPKEITKYTKEILEYSMNLINYDPNYTYEEDDAMEEEEDMGEWEDDDLYMNQEPDDDDDTSWKVRRSAIRNVEALI